jgi:hypothetical protein
MASLKKNSLYNYRVTSGGSSGVAGWAVPTQNQMTYFFKIYVF